MIRSAKQPNLVLFISCMFLNMLYSCTGTRDVAQSPKKSVTLDLANGSTLYFQGSDGNLDTTKRPEVRVDNIRPDHLNNKYATGLNTLTVPAGETYAIELTERSSAYINSGSKLKFPFEFSGQGREVYLEEGEVFFKVTASPGNPFVVHTPIGDVTARGTSFSVSLYKDKLYVCVASGKILLFDPPQHTASQLQPGQQATYKRDLNKVEITPAQLPFALAWLEGQSFFTNQTVQEVSEQLERIYGIDVIIDHAELKNKRMSGSVGRSSRAETIATLCQLGGFEHYYDIDGNLHFKRMN